jgi:PAS domain S-box-containing protein
MIRRYGSAVFSAIAMLLLTILLWRPFTSGFPFLFLFFAVAFSSWNSGIIGGVIASLISSAGAAVFLFRDSPELATRNSVALLVFLILSFVIGWLGATSRLKKNEYEVTLSSIDDSVISIDLLGRIRFLNRCAEKLTGLTLQQAKGKLLPSIFHLKKEDAEVDIHGITESIMQTHSAISMENHLLKNEILNEETPVDLSASAILNDNGKIRGIVFVFRDIHERRLHEAQLIESETRFRSLADHAPVLIWSSGIDRQCNFFNRGWLQFTGRKLEEELGDGWTESIHPRDLASVLNTYNSAFEKREAFQMEFRLLRHDEEYRWIQIRGVPIFLMDNTFTGYIGSCIDVTDEKKSREVILAQLNEKDVLLREIHHRVKNNLQVIMSLLGLQALRAPKEFAEFLQESQNRIRAMAIVHENLYHSEKISRLDLSSYLDRLAKMLATSYLRPDQKISIHVQTNHVEISLDKAIPCGLITNEIVTNSLRHAFPLSKPSGEVCINCVAEDHHVFLRIHDTGIGLPKKIDPGTAETFGMRLIALLVKQLNGELKLDRSSEGTAYEIKFEV